MIEKHLKLANCIGKGHDSFLKEIAESHLGTAHIRNAAAGLKGLYDHIVHGHAEHMDQSSQNYIIEIYER